MENIEKIEVHKGGDRYAFLTGTFTKLKDGDIRIDTLKGEIYIFRKEQIAMRWLNPTDIQKSLETH